MTNKKQSDETRKKISDTRKATEAKKRETLLKFESLGFSKEEAAALIKLSRQDSSIRDFVGLTAERVRSLILSGESGQLRDWADFCDSLLRYDAHLDGVIRIRKAQVAGKPLAVQPSDETEEALACSLFVERALKNTRNLNTMVSHLLHAAYTGIGVCEIVWTYDALENAYWPSIVPLHLKKFGVDENLCVKIDDPLSPEVNGQPLKAFPNKFICHTPQEISPYPNVDGILRVAAFPSFFKRRGITFWLAGAERYAFPQQTLTVPAQCDPSVMAYIAGQFENITSQGLAILKEGIQLNTVSAGASGGDQVWAGINKFMNSEITKLILGGTLNVDTSAQGGAARALGEVHERARLDLVLADAEKLCRTLERDLARAILEMNAHLFTRIVVPELFFDGLAYPALEQWQVGTGAFTWNEFRKSLTYPALPKKVGDRFMKPGDDLNALLTVVEGEEAALAATPRAIEIEIGSMWKDTNDGHRLKVTNLDPTNVYCVDLDGENPERQFTWSRKHFLEICQPQTNSEPINKTGVIKPE